jgi:hypothetical protein
LPRQRRRTEKVHRHPRPRVAEATDAARDALAFIVGRTVETNARDRAVDLSGERAEPHGPAVPERGPIDFDLGVLERDGRVEQHVAIRVGIADAQEVDADGHVRVEARLEILRRGKPCE